MQFFSSESLLNLASSVPLERYSVPDKKKSDLRSGKVPARHILKARRQEKIRSEVRLSIYISAKRLTRIEYRGGVVNSISISVVRFGKIIIFLQHTTTRQPEDECVDQEAAC